jgi:hypothetical protein
VYAPVARFDGKVSVYGPVPDPDSTAPARLMRVLPGPVTLRMFASASGPPGGAVARVKFRFADGVGTVAAADWSVDDRTVTV